MTALAWTLLVLWALSALITVARVGKPREPITPAEATTQLVVSVALSVWLLFDRGVL